MTKFKNTLIIMFILITLIVSIIPTIYADSAENGDNTQNFINRVLELVNIERAKVGLNPLVLDQDLNDAAEIRSREIVILQDHKRPDGRDIRTISYKINGENIGLGHETPELVMYGNGGNITGWMDSPGHRANILRPDFTTLGVGYYKVQNNSRYTNYWIQLFGGLPKVEIVMEQVSGLKIVKTAQNSVELAWNSQSSDSASGYEIYRYNPNTKSYSLIKKLVGATNSLFTDTSVISGTNYSYKVRPYKIYENVAYSDNELFSSIVQTTTNPTKPTIKLSSGRKYVIVKWTKSLKANGYEVYKYDNKYRKYTLKKNINKGSIVKFTDTKLSKTKHSYKVRYYLIANGKKI